MGERLTLYSFIPSSSFTRTYKMSEVEDTTKIEKIRQDNYLKINEIKEKERRLPRIKQELLARTTATNLIAELVLNKRGQLEDRNEMLNCEIREIQNMKRKLKTVKDKRNILEERDDLTSKAMEVYLNETRSHNEDYKYQLEAEQHEAERNDEQQMKLYEKEVEKAESSLQMISTHNLQMRNQFEENQKKLLSCESQLNEKETEKRLTHRRVIHQIEVGMQLTKEEQYLQGIITKQSEIKIKTLCHHNNLKGIIERQLVEIERLKKIVN